MEFKFKQTVTLEDFLVFYKYFLIKTFVKPFNILMIAIFMLYLLSGPFFGKPEMLLYALGFVLFLGILYYWLSRNGKKLYDRDTESFTMDYTIEDASLSFSSADGKYTKMWSEFHSLQETKGNVFLYLKAITHLSQIPMEKHVSIKPEMPAWLPQEVEMF